MITAPRGRISVAPSIVGEGFDVRRAAERLRDLSDLSARLAAHHAHDIASLAQLYRRTLRQGGTLYFVGNGGSAADAQHVATEYMVRYSANRRPLAAVALTTDTSLITACGNDFSFDEIFARQVRALVSPLDLLVVHSTSGNSPNLVKAVIEARDIGAKTVALLGRDGGEVGKLADHALIVPSEKTSHIQELHLAIEHILCELVECSLTAE